jgi:hypothetical protein
VLLIGRVPALAGKKSCTVMEVELTEAWGTCKSAQQPQSCQLIRRAGVVVCWVLTISKCRYRGGKFQDALSRDVSSYKSLPCVPLFKDEVLLLVLSLSTFIYLFPVCSCCVPCCWFIDPSRIERAFGWSLRLGAFSVDK